MMNTGITMAILTRSGLHCHGGTTTTRGHARPVQQQHKTMTTMTMTRGAGLAAATATIMVAIARVDHGNNDGDSEAW